MSDIIDIYSEYNRRGRRGVLPFGTGQAFDDVADLEPGAVVIDYDDGGVLKQKVQVFKNEGIDFIKFGRPALWFDHLSLNKDFEIETKVISVNTASTQFFIAVPEAGNTWALALGFNVSSYYSGRVGDSAVQEITPRDDYVVIKLSKVGSNQFLYINSELVANGAIGAVAFATGGLNVGYDGVVGRNHEGNILCITIRGENGQVIDTIDFTNPAKFDGVTAISDNGIVGTVTDGTPVAALSYDLIPLSILNGA